MIGESIIFIKVLKFKKMIIILIIVILILSISFVSPNVLSVTTKKKAEPQRITWVDFGVSYEALSDTLEIDISSYNKDTRYDWIELLAYLGSKYGGDFKKYKKSDLMKLMSECEKGQKIKNFAKKMQNYNYYYEAYKAVLGGFVGEYEIETDEKDDMGRNITQRRYGLKVFSPIAKGYSFSHYDDFGSSRSYGFRRKHLGHDLMGGVGTPIIAIESGTVENVGWNQYGGWRIGIRSFDKKRYYYYAHLRKDHPYNDMYEGKTVKAGDVIGYLGMTGYSTKENVNNINTPHLHLGMELIFDENFREEKYEIWVDLYVITKLLEKNKSIVIKENNEYYRKYDIFIPETNE